MQVINTHTYQTLFWPERVNSYGRRIIKFCINHHQFIFQVCKQKAYNTVEYWLKAGTVGPGEIATVRQLPSKHTTIREPSLNNIRTVGSDDFYAVHAEAI
jgi:hypothetical protein